MSLYSCSDSLLKLVELFFLIYCAMNLKVGPHHVKEAILQEVFSFHFMFILALPPTCKLKSKHVIQCSLYDDSTIIEGDLVVTDIWPFLLGGY